MPIHPNIYFQPKIPHFQTKATFYPNWTPILWPKAMSTSLHVWYSSCNSYHHKHRCPWFPLFLIPPHPTRHLLVHLNTLWIHPVLSSFLSSQMNSSLVGILALFHYNSFLTLSYETNLNILPFKISSPKITTTSRIKFKIFNFMGQRVSLFGPHLLIKRHLSIHPQYTNTMFYI
jgi:hypothetical protein